MHGLPDSIRRYYSIVVSDPSLCDHPASSIKDNTENAPGKLQLMKAYELLAAHPSEMDVECFVSAQAEVVESTGGDENPMVSADDQYQQSYLMSPEDIADIETMLPFLAVEFEEWD